jgi:hypothetical protein
LNRKSSLCIRLKSKDRIASIHRLDLFYQLRAIEDASVPERGDKSRYLQRRDLHRSLTDRLVDHLDRVAIWILDLPCFLFDLLDASLLSKPKGACHIGNVI